MYLWVSIHAPREGERPCVCRKPKRYNAVSIHAPREGERQLLLGVRLIKKEFQSTLPARGSDEAAEVISAAADSFNPRSPRGGATPNPTIEGEAVVFQSTLPARGSDIRRKYTATPSGFQSTLPARGSDTSIITQIYQMGVSIHAPREGERLDCVSYHIGCDKFQSTLPARGSDVKSAPQDLTDLFQSTLPARGSDYCISTDRNSPTCFNPRSPRGGATT